MRLIFTLLFSLAFAWQLSAQLDSAQRQAVEIFQLRMDIDAAVEKGKYALALDYWVDILAMQPDNPDHYLQRSKLFQRMDDFPAALNDCYMLIRLVPESHRGYWRRAELYFIQSKFSHCLADLDRALYYVDNDKDKYGILFDRGFCKEQQRDFEGAMKDYNDILNNYNPKTLKALHHLGIVYNDLGQRDSAVAILKKTIFLYPEYAGAYISLSYTYTDTERYQDALLLLDHALELSVNDVYTRALSLNNRGYCQLKLGNLHQAHRDLWKAKRLLPNHPYIYRNRAAWFVMRHNRAAACRQWRLAQHYGFEERYGTEVRDLLEKYSRKKE